MFEPYRKEIATAYAAADESAALTASVKRGWRELAQDSVDRAAGIGLLLEVEETEDPEPYPDAFAMCADIVGGHFLVSTAHCEHPLWTPAQNIAFRTVHDVLGHYAASVAAGWKPDFATIDDFAVIDGMIGGEPQHFAVAAFDWEGENTACLAHVRLLLSRESRLALFCECIAQTAYAIERGGFTTQKVADLSHWPQIILNTAHFYEASDVMVDWLYGNFRSCVTNNHTT
jgi:hypothetical protein